MTRGLFAEAPYAEARELEPEPPPRDSKLDTLRCELCPHRCLIPPGGRGLCGVRENSGGKSHIPWYGYVSALARDPIEKKPLYHFRPGSSILSLGFVGCNLHCPFCQNWYISQLRGRERPHGRYLEAEDVAALALEDGDRQTEGRHVSVAYTYSEPLVHPEFLLDCMKLAREQGIANVLVTNGCVKAEVSAKIIPYVDAVNIDLKSFSRETYRETLGGDLSAVLDFIAAAYEGGVHVELTTLIVPGMNDREAELESAARFIADLAATRPGGIIPWHLSAYHPDWRWDAPATKPAALLLAAKRAREILPYVYVGNISGEKNDTRCPHCGKVLIRRRGYQVETGGLTLETGGPHGEEHYCCASCGKELPFIAY